MPSIKAVQPEDFVMVSYESLDEFGDLHKAFIWQRIAYRSQNPAWGGWWRTTVDNMAKDLHLSPRMVRRILSELKESGDIESTKMFRGGSSDHALSYRPIYKESGTNFNGSIDSPNEPSDMPNVPSDTTPSRIEVYAETYRSIRGDVTSTIYKKEEEKEEEYTHPSDAGPSEPSFELEVFEGQAPSTFEEFWTAYPRKTGKQAARKVFESLLKKKLPKERRPFSLMLVSSAQRFANDPNLPEKQFIPYPATWLNGGCWEDEPYPTKKVSRRDMSFEERSIQQISEASKVIEWAREQDRINAEQKRIKELEHTKRLQMLGIEA